jgi:hypothetical protein
LFEVILALDPGSRFTDFLHSRQEQSDQDSDDSDHHQQFDERESAPSTA